MNDSPLFWIAVGFFGFWIVVSLAAIIGLAIAASRPTPTPERNQEMRDSAKN